MDLKGQSLVPPFYLIIQNAAQIFITLNSSNRLTFNGNWSVFLAYVQL